MHSLGLILERLLIQPFFSCPNFRTDEEPIGNGPQVDLLNGKADVHTQFEGIDTQYSITAHDIAPKEKETKVRA